MSTEVEKPCDQCSPGEVQCQGEEACYTYARWLLKVNKINVEKAIKYLLSYQRLAAYGHVGRFLSNEYQEYKETKAFKGEGLMNWCVRMALEALGASVCDEPSKLKIKENLLKHYQQPRPTDEDPWEP